MESGLSKSFSRVNEVTTTGKVPDNEYQVMGDFGDVAPSKLRNLLDACRLRTIHS